MSGNCPSRSSLPNSGTHRLAAKGNWTDSIHRSVSRPGRENRRDLRLTWGYPRSPQRPGCPNPPMTTRSSALPECAGWSNHPTRQPACLNCQSPGRVFPRGQSPRDCWELRLYETPPGPPSSSHSIAQQRLARRWHRKGCSSTPPRGVRWCPREQSVWWHCNWPRHSRHSPARNSPTRSSQSR